MFDILSLANQLHSSKSTYPKGPEHGKISFSENQDSDFISLRLNHLSQAIMACKKTIGNNYIHDKKTFNTELGNKKVDELFREARDNTDIISNLEGLYK